MGDCPFCDTSTAILESALCLARLDNYPVTEGHTLITPRRHVADYFDCTPEEKAAMWAMVDAVQERLCETTLARAFNIGVNVGETAGQTVMHAHIHVIPRYKGDVANPRGGVRGVIPSKQRY